LCEVIKNRGVVAKELSAPGECFGNARAEGALHQRQDFHANSHSREARVRVVWVFPPALTSITERAPQGLSSKPQEWAVVDAIGSGHSFETPGATAPGKAQQHSLGLIVLGVSKQQSQRAGFREGFAKGPVARLSCRVLWAFTAGDQDNLGEHRGESPSFGSASCSSGNVGGIGLELVINNDGADLKAEFRKFESRSPRESQGISSAAQGNEIETV
jgi:hypothetical protein